MRSGRRSTSACRASCRGTNWRRRSGSLGERKAVGLEVVTHIRPGVHRLLRSNYAEPHLTDAVEEAPLFRSGETSSMPKEKRTAEIAQEWPAHLVLADYPRSHCLLSMINKPDPAIGTITRACSLKQPGRFRVGPRPRAFQQTVLPNKVLAEGVGFEPTRRSPACRFSRPVPSTTRPSLQASRVGPATACRIPASLDGL